MRRLRALLVAAALAPVALTATLADAAGPDVVAGSGTLGASGGWTRVAFPGGASDLTPGRGRDGRGTLRIQIQDIRIDVDDTARVECVNAIGNDAVVVAETVKHRGGTANVEAHIVTVTDGGSRGTDRVGLQISTSPLKSADVAAFCRRVRPGGSPVTQGNFTVRDGA